MSIKLIHIGKCGGTYIAKTFDLREYHLERIYKNYQKYVIWIRNPIKRFVSAFWYSYNMLHTNTDELDINNLTFDNCLCPYRIKYKMENEYTYSERDDYLINFFKTPNELAESLTSSDNTKKELAIKLMEFEHIGKGIGWYLFNGDFVKDSHDKILFVGRQEYMDIDTLKLSEIIKIKNKHDKLRENKNKNDKFLSKKAIQNIISFYKETDYKALQELVNHNFISQELFDEYHLYS